jgi:hypothetical protein
MSDNPMHRCNAALGAGLNRSAPACPADRQRSVVIAFAGCTVHAVARRPVSVMENIGTVRAQKEAIQAVRLINLLSRLARKS